MTKAISSYLRSLRIRRWINNLFMLAGTFVAFSLRPELNCGVWLTNWVIAFIATGLVASSNYLLNEILDAIHEKEHPLKQKRPILADSNSHYVAVIIWLIVGAIGVQLGYWLNFAVGTTLLALWFIGAVYCVPPLRLKEVAYLDVLTEATLLPLCALIGWYVIISDQVMPISLIISCWMLSAFLLATRRLAEFRLFESKEAAIRYRDSFGFYSQEKLIVSLLFFLVIGCVFGGVFIVRYNLELIFSVPFVAIFFAYYLKLGLRTESVITSPRRRYRDPILVLYAVLNSVLISILLFTKLPEFRALVGIENTDPVSRLITLEGAKDPLDYLGCASYAPERIPARQKRKPKRFNSRKSEG